MSPRKDGRPPSPVGLRLNPPLSLNGSWDDFRFRDRHAVSSNSTTAKPTILVVYFPLIAISVPEWVEQTGGQSRDPDTCLKIVYLVSGSGTPRNAEHDRMDNSTSAASELIDEFVQRSYVQLHLTPQIVHSQDDVFRCRDNVEFVNRHLRPLIDAHRRRLAKERGDEWHRFMHITLALTDGAPARIQALQACLRNYRPVFLHVWQLKSFWYNRTLTIQDIDFQTFEDMETRPPVSRDALSVDMASLVDQMVEYKKEFDHVRNYQHHELHQFWLRKTRKPVLSILMVELNDYKDERDGGKSKQEDTSSSSSATTSAPRYQFFRGVNCEVSMPTGSLCSERNAIGTALATHPEIRREQLKAVAILSTSPVWAPGKHKPMSPRKTPSSRLSIGSAIVPPSSSTRRDSQETQKFVDGASTSTPSSPSSTSTSTSTSTSSTTYSSSSSTSSSSSSSVLSLKRPRPESEDSLQTDDVEAWRVKRWRANSVSSDPPGSPVVRPLQQGEGEEMTLNPIAPCGACSEWLKKIAEVNPDFRVVMFEDTTCETVFLRSIWGVNTTAA